MFTGPTCCSPAGFVAGFDGHGRRDRILSPSIRREGRVNQTIVTLMLQRSRWNKRDVTKSIQNYRKDVEQNMLLATLVRIIGFRFRIHVTLSSYDGAIGLHLFGTNFCRLNYLFCSACRGVHISRYPVLVGENQSFFFFWKKHVDMKETILFSECLTHDSW